MTLPCSLLDLFFVSRQSILVDNRLLAGQSPIHFSTFSLSVVNQFSSKPSLGRPVSYSLAIHRSYFDHRCATLRLPGLAESSPLVSVFQNDGGCLVSVDVSRTISAYRLHFHAVIFPVIIPTCPPTGRCLTSSRASIGTTARLDAVRVVEPSCLLKPVLSRLAACLSCSQWKSLSMKPTTSCSVSACPSSQSMSRTVR